jgi:plasmid stability protein
MKRIIVGLSDEAERELDLRAAIRGRSIEETASEILSAPTRWWACNCGALERAADDPSSPVQFDEETNEYHLVTKTDSSESRTLIRYCCFCGGRAPASKRRQLVEPISGEEIARLQGVFKGIRTFEEAALLLGPPDRDVPGGVAQVEIDGSRAISSRYVVYSKISDKADVVLTDSGNGEVTISYIGKPKSRT